MDRDFVIYNLKEAQEELQKTISEIESDSSFEFGDFFLAMQHLYHHVNTAWNAKNDSEYDTQECTKENFQKWRSFPNDIEMEVD